MSSTDKARKAIEEFDVAMDELYAAAATMDEPEVVALELVEDWRRWRDAGVVRFGLIAIPAVYAGLDRYWHRYVEAFRLVIDYDVPRTYLRTPAEVRPELPDMWPGIRRDVTEKQEQAVKDAYDYAVRSGGSVADVAQAAAEPVMNIISDVKRDLSRARAITLAVIGAGVGVWILSRAKRLSKWL